MHTVASLKANISPHAYCTFTNKKGVSQWCWQTKKKNASYWWRKPETV